MLLCHPNSSQFLHPTNVPVPFTCHSQAQLLFLHPAIVRFSIPPPPPPLQRCCSSTQGLNIRVTAQRPWVMHSLHYQHLFRGKTELNSTDLQRMANLSIRTWCTWFYPGYKVRTCVLSRYLNGYTPTACPQPKLDPPLKMRHDHVFK